MVDFPFFFCYNKFNKGGDKVNERFFQFAREASLKSDYTRRGSAPRIGVVAVYKGSIVAEAWNTDKTSPLQARYNEYRYYNPTLPEKSHAETVLVQRLRWKFGDSLDWSRVQIYLYRELKNGKLAMARPCRSCFHLLRDLGVRKVFYTTENGFAEERIL